ncbi:NSFL1 cofactor p47-like isoform X2 [Corticium candelabrum]|uniref:NSFL1 cofactor p47-like isoform X2 n=1 Tax=Corticium candelabrum TaxID=121492 RepID=UPI002E274E22|nr:NSFL1 cofactor p47-like isoform X2 [Corticium candelabrum]
MSDDQDRLVSCFCETTGLDPGRARFYLEGSQWDLQTALSSYFDDAPDSHSHSASAPQHLSASRDVGGFRTMHDILASHSNKSSDDDKDEGQEFYAGGSEHASGTVITGPPKKAPTARELAEAVFEAGKRQGAKSVDEESASRPKQPQKFRGTGYRLGETAGNSEKIADDTVEALPEVRRKLTFWANGFCIDDGPLRDGSSDKDRAFIESVTKGQIPDELVSEAQGSEVHVNVEDRREEQYRQPKPVLKPFSGEGHKLGNPDIGDTSVAARGLAATSANVVVAGFSSHMSVDSSQPCTSIQIRLANGTRC